MNTEELEQMANKIRKHIIQMIYTAGSGHVGGSLSAVELLVGLYFHQLVHNSKDPNWEDRDRVVISKGHASAVLYSCLAEAGYFPTDALLTYRKLGSPLQGHPSRNGLPGVEISTGSLGQGLSVGLGMALGLKRNKKDAKVFVLLGDGECDCGQIWEAAMAAAHYSVGNLCAIIDRNGLQIDGTNKAVMTLEPLADKWMSFGWDVASINGHDFDQILAAYHLFRYSNDKPFLILADTIKGKGISFMENKLEWHGKAISKEKMEEAMIELERVSHV